MIFDDAIGPTQPKGAMIEDLYTNNQTKAVIYGLSDANDGAKKRLKTDWIL